MNRVGLGLAIGAGYLLGRTKKLKFAVAVGSMVAGRKLNLTPRGIAELVNTQLQNNPQFKEIGDQLRTDLQGVGKAASGALVERQLDAIAGRLHGRTAQVRDQLSGVASQAPGVGSEEEAGAEDEEGAESAESAEDTGKAARKAPAKKAPAKRTAAAEKAPAKKAPARKTAAKTSRSAKQAAGKKTAGARGGRAGLPKGGGER
ncbi:DNA primase [Streptomyces sp. HMX87]|uniref:DNA primase n=1 Tax=Streptomyces sp. HMX87 TaxID=3390849 RepID=UPI003A88DA77